MSYILDALRRSEQERARRDSGPSIVMPTPPATAGRRWLPWLIAAALTANALAIGFLLLQSRPALQPRAAAEAEPAAEPEPPAPALADVAGRPPAPAAAAVHPAQPVQAAASAATGTAILAPLLETMPLEFRQALPEIGISVHVYAQQPSARWVLINGRRVREGEEAAAGVRLERIAADGVVLRFRERSFLLRVR